MVCNLSFADTINIVMPTAAGGNVDVFARALSKVLTDSDIENVIMYNPGANGDIAYNQTMNRSESSMLIAPINVSVFSHIVQNRENFHTKNMKIFAPMVETPFAFVTSSNGFKSFSEMVAYAKVNELPCGVSGANSIEILRINKQYKTNFLPITYKGTSQIKTDLLGGHIKCAYDGAGAYSQDNETGSVKYLASNLNSLKNVPNIDTVLSHYKFQMWFAVAIPNDSKLLKNDKLINTLLTINSNKEYTDKLSQHNLYPTTTSNKINDNIEKLSNQYRNVQ